MIPLPGGSPVMPAKSLVDDAIRRAPRVSGALSEISIVGILMVLVLFLRLDKAVRQRTSTRLGVRFNT